MDLTYSDLSKAFDTVSHGRLLVKLNRTEQGSILQLRWLKVDYAASFAEREVIELEITSNCIP